MEPITTASRLEASTVCCHSSAGIVGSSPARFTDVTSAFLLICFVLCRERPCDRLIPFPRSPIKRLQISFRKTGGLEWHRSLVSHKKKEEEEKEVVGHIVCKGSVNLFLCLIN
jgi:hypothetical protein